MRALLIDAVTQTVTETELEAPAEGGAAPWLLSCPVAGGLRLWFVDEADLAEGVASFRVETYARDIVHTAWLTGDADGVATATDLTTEAALALIEWT